MTVYNQLRALGGRNDTLFDNEEALDSNYNGGDITVNKRMSDGWSLMAGASYGKSIGDVLGGDLNNPNSKEFRRGLLGNDVPWSYRLSGVYDLPYRVATVSGTMQYYKGVPESTTVIDRQRRRARRPYTGDAVARRRAARNRSPPERVLARYQSEKVDPVGYHVVRAEAGFLQPHERSHGHQLADRRSAPTYHRASTIQAGRMIKVGFNFEF